MTALAMDVRDLDDAELDSVAGGAAWLIAIGVGLVLIAAERYGGPFVDGMIEGFTDDK